MLKRALLAMLAVPALAGLAFVATRLTPGPQRDGATLLPSGWRIHPAGRQVAVGTLPLNLMTLSDGSLLVTNNGYGENGLMRIDPVGGGITWRFPLKAAWLGLARSGRDWRDTVWASGAGTNRVYRLAWLGGAGWTTDTVTLADTSARLFAAGLAVAPTRGLVAVVGNLSDSVYLIDAATLARRGAVAVGHRPYTVAADSTHLYVSDWGDSTVSVIDLSVSPPVRRSVFVGPHPSALALRGRELFVALAGANGVARIDLGRGAVLEQLTVALDPHAPLGSDPNALALARRGAHSRGMVSDRARCFTRRSDAVRRERQGQRLGRESRRQVHRRRDHGVGLDRARSGRRRARPLHARGVRPQPVLEPAIARRHTRSPHRPAARPPRGLHHP